MEPKDCLFYEDGICECTNSECEPTKDCEITVEEN